MAETFNPIISHLYSGQGGVSREITKYNNATISEINVVDNGVTTKYDFGKLSTIPVTGSVLKNTIKQPLDSIKFYGNTMRWCQLCVDPTFSTASKWEVPSSMTIANNKITMQGVENSSVAFSMSNVNGNNFKGVNGHIYIFSAIVTSSVQTTGAQFRVFTGSEWDYPIPPTIPSGKSRVSVMWAYNKQSSNTCRLHFYSNLAGISGCLPNGETMEMENLMVFDLTYIFGEGNEPSTEAEFIRRLRKLVYPYSPGEIISIEQASAYLYGLNIWDEEWEVGGYSSANGTKDASTNKFRSKNPFRVLPSTDYYATIGQEDYGYITLFYYDGANNYVGYYSVPYQGSGSFTTPANSCFVTFQVVKEGWNNQYHNDICISLSNASTNGTYEASKGEQSMRLLSTNIYDKRFETTDSALTSSGEVVNNYQRVVSDYIDIFGASYVSVNYGASFAFYDGSKAFISAETKSFSIFRVYTVPSTAKYIRIDNVLNTISGQDIMMVKGQYTSETLPSYTPFGYGYATLNGVGDAIDTVTVEKNVTLPFGLVDLGTLKWLYDSSLDIFHVDQFDGKTNGAQMVCSNYEATLTLYPFSSTLPNKSIGNKNYYTTNNIWVKDSAYTDAATFKAAMKGIYLYYELADYPLNDTPILAGSYVRKIGKYTFTGNEEVYPYGEGYYFDSSVLSQPPKLPTMNVVCPVLHVTNAAIDVQTDSGAINFNQNGFIYIGTSPANLVGVTLYYELATPVETALTAQQCAEILNGAFTKSKYSTLLTDNDNGQIDQTVDVGMWEQR